MVPDILALWRWHDKNKTMSRGIAYGFRSEEVRIAELYAHFLPIQEEAELRAELELQQKWTIVREAMWLLGEGRRKEALSLMFRGARTTHSLLAFRPWLGALRRALLAFNP